MASWLIGVSVVLIFLSVFLGVRTHRWVSEAVPVNGKVVELIAKRGQKGGTTYAPKVRFERQGKEEEFVSEVSSQPAAFKVGEEVKVLVHDGDGKNAIATFGQLYMVPVGAFIIGFFFGSIGLFLKFSSSVFGWLHPHLR